VYIEANQCINIDVLFDVSFRGNVNNLVQQTRYITTGFMPSPNYQDTFFNELSNRFKDKKSLAGAVSKALSIGMDGAYRRISGRSNLQIDELLTLAKKFNVHLPGGSDGDVRFSFNNQDQTIRTPADYIDQLEAQLMLVDSWPGKQLYYATADLPFFYELMAPTLMAFKLYVFGVTSWGFEEWKDKAFSPRLIDPAVLEKAAAISSYAYRVPSKEIWSSGLLNASLSQLEYIAMIGNFADNTVPFKILEEISIIVDHLENMAIHGRKFAPGEDPTKSNTPFSIHYNELLYVSTTILVDSPQASLLFLSFITPNYLVTTDRGLGEEVRRWFDELLGEATELGKNTRKIRNWFFNRLRSQVAATRQRLELQFQEE
jgi:hypothetical protein